MTAHWTVIIAWLLMTPPVPLGTELPPISRWSRLSTHKTEQDCEQKRDDLRQAARQVVTNDPNAHALKVATALGRLQSRCIELKEQPKPEPPVPKVETPPAAAPAEPAANDGN